ncbi:hypothetical protein [Arthrobacter sp. 35W]|uniref:hypothetical protein n=1 Tax=Arthrobacter sp. 35W TaxID=1132441 RepID=UPI0012DCA91B|nr:hypothetical protein [Arthrobacter sp. 35W]
MRSSTHKRVVALGVAAVLALSGCSLLPGSPPGSKATGTGTSQSAAAGSTSGSTAGSTPADPTACLSVAGVLAGVSFLPLSAALGAVGPEDVEKAKASINEAMGQVPEELKPDFAKLSAVVESMGTDLAKFDSAAYEEAVKPITTWLEVNCGG